MKDPTLYKSGTGMASQGSPLAAPVLFFSRSSNDTIISNDSATCICPADQRSTFDILWSCLATIFACSWVSVHPNIPGPDESRTRIALRRLELMFWAIVMPEMTILWAMRQWYGARRLARQWQAKGWKKAHGYFIQMGGFMLYEGAKAKGILSPKKLEKLSEAGRITFPTITEEEIQDHSKADALSKTIVIGQTTWFILQCLARAVQGLNLTLLELLTVALAFLNGFMYLFWWNKPLDVQTSVPVYILDIPVERQEKPKSVPTGSDPTAPSNEVEVVSTPSHDAVPATPLLPVAPTLSSTESWTQSVSRSIHGAMQFLFNIVSSVTSWTRALVEKRGYLWILYAISVLGPKKLVMLIYQRLDDMHESSRTCNIHEGQMRVPTFYATKTPPSADNPISIAVCVIAAAFGAIHCAGWALAFPSDAEAWIWRISSIVISVTPLLIALASLFDWCAEQAEGDSLSKKIVRIFATGFVVPFLAALPFYVIARLTLLVEAFAGLRVLTPSALEVVKWTTLIPHI